MGYNAGQDGCGKFSSYRQERNSCLYRLSYSSRRNVMCSVGYTYRRKKGTQNYIPIKILSMFKAATYFGYIEPLLV